MKQCFVVCESREAGLTDVAVAVAREIQDTVRRDFSSC
jgi:hypothetical protein